MTTGVTAALDGGGNIISWQYDVWSNTHSTRPGSAGSLLAGLAVASPFPVPPPQVIPQPEGGGDRNAIPIYAIPNARVVHHFIPDMPLRVSAMRALGAYMNVFSIESFMDELAKAAGIDPVEYRLQSSRRRPSAGGGSNGGRQIRLACPQLIVGRARPRLRLRALQEFRGLTARLRSRSKSNMRPAWCVSCARSPRSTAARQ